jgi:hypothetical protein
LGERLLFEVGFLLTNAVGQCQFRLTLTCSFRLAFGAVRDGWVASFGGWQNFLRTWLFCENLNVSLEFCYELFMN